MRAILFALVLTGAGACASEEAQVVDTRTYVHAAYCSMGDRTTIHVTALLQMHGIPCRIWGSLLYTVDVPEEDVDRARRILWDEAVRIPFDVGFDVAVDDYTLAEEETVTQTLNLRRDLMIRQAAYAADTDLGGVLRHGEIVRASKLFPFVVAVETTSYEYLDEDSRYKFAHEYWVTLGKEPGTESHRLRFGARGAGKFVEYWGGWGDAYDEP